MSIVTLSDALLGRQAGKPGAILRDKVLCGLCLRIGRRTQTFCVATSVRGKQVRVTLGRWPLITVAQARELALPILRKCRAGEYSVTTARVQLPTLRQALGEYAKAKKVRPSSLTRYESLLKTHFQEWLDRPVSALRESAFGDHCHQFAQSKGAALVDLGRGIIGSITRFLGAVYGVAIESPFVRLGAAGLLPGRPEARARKLTEGDLPAWHQAVGRLPELQRDYLKLMLLTGLRKNEGSEIKREDVDLGGMVLTIPETKGRKPHTLPITEMMREILERRYKGLESSSRLFGEMSVDHVTEMAERAGAPAFTLHDLRKLVASAGARMGIGDAILRRILGHAPKRGDVLNKHYVSLSEADIDSDLTRIQNALV
ncbi:integrase family protein [Burkholderia sp. Ac-20353]|uniref:site-specific integrase n=1 Tax=Burkholderia sp. Ac-20353 TaxID=2703894 RepID=UPI00197B1307|nr:integrase family protein [Burkholderia sp. Ac-20353]MBN3791559.1 integrase family protein [Burkholderia sp. Ac-20353]